MNLDGYYPMYGYEKTHVINKLGEIIKLETKDSKGRISRQRKLKLYESKVGYLVVNIKQKRQYVHRLMALTFLPNKKKTVNHKNGVKVDNRLENLEWNTYSENNQHAYDLGLKRKPPKFKVKSIKNGVEQIHESCADFAALVGVKVKTVYDAISNSSKSVKGYKVFKVPN